MNDEHSLGLTDPAASKNHLLTHSRQGKRSAFKED